MLGVPRALAGQMGCRARSWRHSRHTSSRCWAPTCIAPIARRASWRRRLPARVELLHEPAEADVDRLFAALDEPVRVEQQPGARRQRDLGICAPPGAGADAERRRAPDPEQPRRLSGLRRAPAEGARPRRSEPAALQVDLRVGHRRPARRLDLRDERSSRSITSAGPSSAAASARTALRSWPMALAATMPRPTTSPTTIADPMLAGGERVVPVAAHLERLDRRHVARGDLEARVRGGEPASRLCWSTRATSRCCS